MSLQRADAAVFLAALCLAATVQWTAGAYTSDFDAQADEPAHVVSSLLVRDYLTDGIPRNPLAFARTYYDHFPKVAIGHWPPLFHLTEALWTLVFGRTKGALIAWPAVLAAAVATLIFSWVRRDCGPVPASCAAIVFVASPLVQMSISAVMLDILLALTALAAACALGDYFESGRKRDAVRFVLCGLAALSTNGRGIAVALLFIPACAMRSRRWLWALIPMSILFFLPGLQGGRASFTESLMNLWRFPLRMAIMMSWPVAALALVGGGSVFRARDSRPRWAPMPALAISSLMLHSLGNWPLDDRYLLVAVPAVAALAGEGCRLCLVALDTRYRVVACALFVCAVVAFDVSRYSKKPDLGYHFFANQPWVQVHETSLIAGDPFHEGAFIAEMDLAEVHLRDLLRDRRRVHTVLRGSKKLAQSTWAGNSYRMLFHTSREVDAWLDATGVTLVIAQTAGRPHVAQLLEAVTEDSVHWRELPAAHWPRDVRVFERVML